MFNNTTADKPNIILTVIIKEITTKNIGATIDAKENYINSSKFHTTNSIITTYLQQIYYINLKKITSTTISSF